MDVCGDLLYLDVCIMNYIY